MEILLNAGPALAALTELEQNQVPFAMKNALYDVAVDFQMQEFLHEKSIFEMRRPEWVQRSNKLVHAPTKTELWATVRVQPPGSQDRSDIIGKFEDETTKESRRPGGLVAVPINARRGKRDIILPSQKPGAFKLTQVGNRVLGNRGTYLVKGKDGREYIWQHQKGGDVLLYILMPSVHITPDLEYEKTARWTVETYFQKRFDARWQAALASTLGGTPARAMFRDDPVAYLTER